MTVLWFTQVAAATINNIISLRLKYEPDTCISIEDLNSLEPHTQVRPHETTLLVKNMSDTIRFIHKCSCISSHPTRNLCVTLQAPHFPLNMPAGGSGDSAPSCFEALQSAVLPPTASL